MPIQNDSLNRKLYDLLNSRGYNPVPRDSDVASAGKSVPPEEADVFKFTFTQGDKEIDDAWVSVDGAQNLTLYYDQELANQASERTPGTQFDDSWYGLLRHLKKWAHARQLSFKLEPKEKIDSDMSQRTYMKKKEQIAEGYYPMGKSASYSDAVPTVKIILQHSRQIQEGEQRYRNVSKIFLENTEGERFLSPTNKPGLAQVYARHLAEGGIPNDDRWNHLKSICEEYSKMAGFVRAVRGNQFNESAQRLVNEGLNHYQSLRESLSKLRGSRGYNAYFESWTPSLMENEGDEQNNLNELFVQETLDPRIESVMPILNKLSKNLGEMKEVSELAEWADSLVEAPGAETLAHNQATEKSRLDAFDLDETDGGQQALNPGGIPEGMLDGSDGIDSPVASAILRRILMQRTDLLAKHGPEKVSNAIGDVAEFVGDVDEIGSSDVSGWIKQIEQSLSGVDEGILDTVKKVGGKVLDKLGHGSDEDLLKDLQKKAGVRGPNHGKPSMAHSDVEKRVDEEDMDESALQAYLGNKKYGKEGMDALRQAGRNDASKEEMAKIRDKFDKIDEGAGYDGSEPLDLSTNPSVNDVFKRALYIYDYEGYGNDMDYSEDDAIDQYVARKFGQDVLDQLTHARNQQYFGRDDGRGTGGSRSSNLGMAGKKPGDFRTTKAGKMHSQDAKMMKAKVADRLGRHPEPMLPEGEFAGDFATGEAGQWRNKGPKANKPATVGDLVGEGREDLEAIKRLLGEGWKGELAGGTAGGIAGNMAGNAIAPGIGGIVGGAIGGTAGGMAGRALGDTVDEEQLNEFAPLMAAGARAIIPLLSKVGPALGRMATGAGKAGSEIAGKTATGIGRGTADVAKSAAQSAAQNADKIGVGLGAYQAITDVANSTMGGVGEVYRDAGQAASAIAQAVGGAIDGKTIAELAGAAVKYAIPIGILLAVLYGGKKLIDQVMSEGADDSATGALGQMVGKITPNPSDFVAGFKKTFEGQEDLDTIKRLLGK